VTRDDTITEHTHESWVSETEEVSTGHYKILRHATSGARRESPYGAAYPVESTAVLPKQFAAGFRLAGVRVAGLLQNCRTLSRWEAQQRKDVVYIVSDRLLEHVRTSNASGARIVALESENDRLRADAMALRRIIARNRAQSVPERWSPDPEVITKASEFLVVLPQEYRALAFSLFETGELLLDEVARDLGRESTQHFANLLGWAEVGYVSGSKFVATRLGAALGETLKSFAAEDSVPEPSESR
jgi:hypothetical protein